MFKNKEIYINPKEQNDSTGFMETSIIKTQEELNFLFNNNIHTNISQTLIPFIIETSISKM